MSSGSARRVGLMAGSVAVVSLITACGSGVEVDDLRYIYESKNCTDLTFNHIEVAKLKASEWTDEQLAYFNEAGRAKAQELNCRFDDMQWWER